MKLSEEIAEFKCSICGSILRISPENIVSICEYCGGLNIVSGIIDCEDIFISTSVNVDKVLEEFLNRVRKDVDLKKISDKLRIVSTQGWYVPFWISRVLIRGEVVYIKRQYRGKKVEIIRNRDSFSEEIDIDIIARRQVKNLALRELIKTYFRQKPQLAELKNLAEDWWRSNKLTILNIEFDRKESEISLREEAVDSVRRIWEDKVDEIEFFKAEVKKMERPKLIFLPLWEVVYEYNGSFYTAYHQGWSGHPLIFYEPITMSRRLLYAIGMFTSIILGSIIGSALSLLTLDSLSDAWWIILFLLFILALIGYRSAKGFISDIRVEKSWR